MDAVDENGYLAEGYNRIGKDHPISFMWQGSQAWKDDLYGYSGQKIGAIGCPAVSLAEALRLLGVQAGATPKTVLAKAARAAPPVFDPGSSAAYLARMARANGLKCADDPIIATKGDARAKARHLRFAITRTLADGGVCWVNVDSDADGRPNHWLCVYQATRTHLWGTDSATAKAQMLDIETLTGLSKWGSTEKRYEVLRVRPLHL